jgi:hypothetical protein
VLGVGYWVPGVRYWGKPKLVSGLRFVQFSKGGQAELFTRLVRIAKIAALTPITSVVNNSYVESLTDRMAGIEKQDHNPGVEQQLQANRVVEEPGHGHRQKVTERHTNESAQQSAHDRPEPN